MKQAAFAFGGRSTNPTKKPSPAQLAARAKFADMARTGGFAKKKARTANKMISRVPKLNPAKTNPVKTNPINAGEFAMTVNGKTVYRFFAYTNDPWANSHGFEYQLLSNVTKNGSFVKFTKTRAIVAVDEAADGSAVTETWAIRKLMFYQKNPAKTNPMQGTLLRLHGNMYGQVRQDGNGLYTATVLQKVNTGIGDEMDFYESKEFKTKAGAARFLANHGKNKSNPAKTNPAKKSKPYCYLCILSGGDQYGLDERTAVSMAFSPTLMRHAYKCYAIPPKVEKNPAFQDYAGSQQMFYMSLAEMRKQLQKFN